MIRHAIPIAAHFDWALAVTFAADPKDLERLLAPGLTLDTLREHGFLAAACVQTRRLRPAALPAFFGLDFFLAGYRLFTRFRSSTGEEFRGLQILASETNRWPMVAGGNLLTHYGYRKTTVTARRQGKSLLVSTSSGLDIEADLEASEIPEGSVFRTWEEARRFAGPMPFTFASEEGGRSVVRVRGVRANWKPRPVRILRARAPWLEHRIGKALAPAAGFLVEDIDYLWERGVRERLP